MYAKNLIPRLISPPYNKGALHFRHTNETLLIAQGVDVVTVLKRLGHTRTSTTTDIYSHSLRKPDIIATEKLENLFTSKTNAEAK